MFKGNVKKVRAALSRVQRSAKAVGGAVAVGVLSLSTQAYAALPTAVTTELGTSKTDVSEAGGLAFGVFLAIIFFVWLRRVTR